MAQGVDGGRGRRPGVVTNAKRRGPGGGFWIVLGIVVLIGVGTLGWLASRPKAQITRVDPNLPPTKSDGYVMGSASAPVEVIEFGDFECPSCGQFASITEPDVRARLVNTGKVRMRYFDFPLPMHKNTWDASLAAACAAEQGKFWEMHDALFANQDRWNTEATSRPRGPISDLAKSVGLDMSKYGDCMDSERYRPKIQAHLAEAERRNIGQTPTFVINGLVVPGAVPYDRFKAIVDSAETLTPARADSARPAARK